MKPIYRCKTDLFGLAGGLGTNFLTGDFNLGISNLWGSVNLSSLTGSLGVIGRGGGVGAGEEVVVSSSGGGGVLDGVAGLQHTNTTHMQCFWENPAMFLCEELIN